jgi:hypothetical protein
MLPEIQFFDLVRIRCKGAEQVKADQNSRNNTPYPIYTEFWPFPLTVVIVSPGPEPGKVVFIVLF